MDFDWSWTMSAIYQIYTLIYIFGGVVPYIPQYLELKRLNSIRGFSTYVCLTLLVANILRICFWFVQPFSTPLLVQSVIMVVAMLVMMHRASLILHDELHERSPPLSGGFSGGLKSSRSIFNNPVRYFWQWTTFSSYLIFTIAFVVMSTAVTNLLSNSALFVHFLGFAALFVEALLGLPQLAKNYQNGSTKGMSIMMVFMWTVGDVAKSVFFMLEKAPLQFPLCGWLQVSLDLVIFAQHLYYTYVKR
ncbi:PQ-loop repeat-containing protein 1 [Fasciolopsis buskii]|uniref:Solute carrier family 66 member 2 n=1 Tax=Fasciolopsis buskii TaxID=27845 RepID=A0A8E0VIL8_9TREM|nr:PQ-loop repeat-containing protein 1 [Fasciolopsis buski]